MGKCIIHDLGAVLQKRKVWIECDACDLKGPVLTHSAGTKHKARIADAYKALEAISTPQPEDK